MISLQEEKKEQLHLKKLKTDSVYRVNYLENFIDEFAQYYLSDHLKSEIGWLHYEWYEILHGTKDIALACPREHAKSTIFVLIYVLFCILYLRRKFIVIISDTKDQAETLLGGVVEELETNKRIINDFGKIAGYVPPKAEEKEKWTTSDIVTTSGVKVIARGWKAKLRGLKKRSERPDLIILDDVENDEQVESDIQRKKLSKIFNKSIMNLGSQDTRFIIIGTILHYDSLLNNLIEKPPEGFLARRYKAITNNKPIWSEWWSMLRLIKRRARIGTLAFEQEFQNNPMDEGQKIFNISKYYDNVDPNECYRYAYLDLASREKLTSDYNAIVTILKHKKTGSIYTYDPQRMRGRLSEIVDWFVKYYEKHRHNKIGIEDNNFQTWFSQTLEEETQADGIYIPIEKVVQIKSKIKRASSVAVYVENGTVGFNKSHESFNSEVEGFPKFSHDDWVDSMVEGIRMAIEEGTESNIMSGRNKIAKSSKNGYHIVNRHKRRQDGVGYPSNY